MPSLLNGFLILTTLVCLASGKITMEQARQSGELVRNVCQPKNKVTDEVALGMREGVFPNDKGAKCYVQCILEMMGMMKKSKVNYDGAMKQFDTLLPEELVEPYKKGLNICKDAPGGEKNACEAAYKLITCFHSNTPEFTFA